MPNTNITNNEIMEMFAQMVNERVAQEVAAAGSRGYEGNANGYARTSRLYGRNMCGFPYNPYLVRRWIPAQYTIMMRNEQNRRGVSINEIIRERCSVKWAIEYIVEECRKLDMLAHHDRIAYEERKLFWYEDTVRKILANWLRAAIEVEEDEVRRKLYRATLHRVRQGREFGDFYKAMAGVKIRKINGLALHEGFIEGYKKTGAYYTLKNAVMFQNKEIVAHGTGEILSGREAVNYLRRRLECGDEGYRFHALAKATLL